VGHNDPATQRRTGEPQVSEPPVAWSLSLDEDPSAATTEEEDGEEDDDDDNSSDLPVEHATSNPLRTGGRSRGGWRPRRWAPALRTLAGLGIHGGATATLEESDAEDEGDDEGPEEPVTTSLADYQEAEETNAPLTPYTPAFARTQPLKLAPSPWAPVTFGDSSGVPGAGEERLNPAFSPEALGNMNIAVRDRTMAADPTLPSFDSYQGRDGKVDPVGPSTAYSLINGRVQPTPTIGPTEGPQASESHAQNQSLTSIPVIEHPMVDIGARLQDARYQELGAQGDATMLLRKARLSNVQHVIVPCTSLKHARLVAELSVDYPREVYCTIGVHPHCAQHEERGPWEHFEKLLTSATYSTGIVGIGECGLDFETEGVAFREVQMRVFREQVLLARDKGLPLLCSERLAHTWFMEVLEECAMPGDQVCLVRFNGTEAELQRYVDYGCHIGVCGNIVPDKRGTALRAMLHRVVPMGRVMLMSDSPGHHPQELKGQLNEPCLLPYLCQSVARAYRTKADTVAAATYHTALSFFRIRSQDDATTENRMGDYLNWLE